MADYTETIPTPIQRNSADVAMDLLNIHLLREHVDTSQIGELYARYYVLAKTLQGKHFNDLKGFLPAEIASKIQTR